MPEQKSLKVNFIMNAILTMSSFIFPLITFPYVSRVLLPVGTGRVSFATSVISYFLMFAQLGIPTYGIRACAKVRDNREELTRTAHELLFINLIMSAASYVVLAFMLVLVPRMHEDRTLFIIISLTIFLSSIGMEWLYRAMEQYTYITVRSLIFKGIALVAMFLLIHQQSDYVIYGGISIFASSASNVLNFINAHRYIDMRPVGNYHLRRHLKAVAVFFAMSIATTVYTNMDTVMLGFMTTDADVGYYNAAVRIKTILISIVTSLGTVLLPRASYYVENKLMDDFWRITKKAIHFVFLFATPLALFFFLYARQGVLFLSGSAYEPAIVPMMIIMPTLLLIGLTNILGIQILVPQGREMAVLYSEIAGAVANVIVNVILIPRMQSTGAAIGTLVAEAVVLVVQYWALRTQVREAFGAIKYWKMIVALLLGTAGSLWILSFDFRNIVILVITACLFFGIYVLFLWGTKEPLAREILGQMFSVVRRGKQTSK